MVKNNALIQINLCFVQDRTTCSVDLKIWFFVVLHMLHLLTKGIGAILFFFLHLANSLFVCIQKAAFCSSEKIFIGR